MVSKEKLLRALPFVIAIVALIAIVAVLLLFVRPKSSAPSSQVQKIPVASVIIPLTPTTLAASLPESFPMETGSVLESSRATNPETHQVKVLRTTITSKSVEAAFKVYTDFLSANAWTIGNIIDVPDLGLKSLSADKGSEHVEITVSYNNSSKSNTVTVVYTMPPQQ